MSFDASKHLTEARKGGPKDYLQVKWRIVWLRHEHPDAEISTEERHHDVGQSATFWARVTIPGRGSATGHGMEERKDFHDYYEKAEAKAIGRAIANLGYGTQFVGNELDEGERIVDSPTEPAGSPDVPATPPDDLALMRDITLKPEARKAALHRYYSAADSPADLNVRADAAYETGIDADVLKAAFRHHHDRLSKQLAPAGHAG